MNLVRYHVRMNHKDEAMSAIKEAITIAQGASDHSCLQHVLFLLHRISDDAEKQRLIERCVTKCVISECNQHLSRSFLGDLTRVQDCLFSWPDFTTASS
mgnify:CR=1 FL=1